MWVLGSCGCGGGGLFALGTRRGYVFAGIVFLDLEKILLGMGANLNDVFGAHMGFDLFPRPAVFLEGVEEELVLFIGPVFAYFGDDILFAGLLVWRRGWGGWGRLLLSGGRVCGKWRLVWEVGGGGWK